MPPKTNLPRNEQLTAIMTAVRVGALGWTLEDVDTGAEISSVEIHLHDLAHVLGQHPAWSSAAASIRAGYRCRRRKARQGQRTLRLLKTSTPATSSTSLSVVHAHDAARLLGLNPPAVKSLEALAARYRKTHGWP